MVESTLDRGNDFFWLPRGKNAAHFGQSLLVNVHRTMTSRDQ